MRFFAAGQAQRKNGSEDHGSRDRRNDERKGQGICPEIRARPGTRQVTYSH
jgi:hypothetical protein